MYSSGHIHYGGSGESDGMVTLQYCDLSHHKRNCDKWSHTSGNDEGRDKECQATQKTTVGQTSMHEVGFDAKWKLNVISVNFWKSRYR